MMLAAQSAWATIVATHESIGHYWKLATPGPTLSIGKHWLQGAIKNKEKYL